MVDVQRVSTSTVAKTGFSWAGFFKDAGLPASVCANYAVLFIDNRMKKSMLPDLNKEILHELGIRAIGDIISILRQADALCNSNNSAPKAETRAPVKAEQTTRDKESKSEDSFSDQNKGAVKRRSSKETPQKGVATTKRNVSEESATRKIEPSKKKRSDDEGRKRANDQSRKISLVKRSQGSKDDSPPNETRKYRHRRRISEARDSGCDSKTDSGTEEPVKPKKRMVVLEHKTVVKARSRRDSSPNPVRLQEQRTSRKETIRDDSASRVYYEKSSNCSSEDSESDNENVSKLRRLNYLAQKWKNEVSDSQSAGRDSARYEECSEHLGSQTVKFVFPDQQLVKLKLDEERKYGYRSDEDEISRKRSNDKIIRAALIEGRRKLDRSRSDNGLGYLGSFKTDIEDEVKPGTLVSDQRDVKVLNRLGAKKEKSEEPEPSKGSLTILDNDGGRVTTSLSRQDRTVVNLTKSDNSVFKRLGPEQKVPTNPLSMGVLGSHHKSQTSHRPERDRSDRSLSPDRDSTHSQPQPSFSVRSRGKLPSRTDLRDVIKCKGGFIPPVDRDRSPSPPSRYQHSVTSSSSRGIDDSSFSLSTPDLRNRLSNGGHVKKHVQDGRVVKLTTPKNQRSERTQESRESFVKNVMKRVIDSRNANQKWDF